MGIFEVSEANRTIKCLELKAYDFMLRFERNFNHCRMALRYFLFIRIMILRPTGMCSTMWGGSLAGFSVSTGRESSSCGLDFCHHFHEL